MHQPYTADVSLLDLVDIACALIALLSAPALLLIPLVRHHRPVCFARIEVNSRPAIQESRVKFDPQQGSWLMMNPVAVGGWSPPEGCNEGRRTRRCFRLMQTISLVEHQQERQHCSREKRQERRAPRRLVVQRNRDTER
jgi:hypothetical protein